MSEESEENREVSFLCIASFMLNLGYAMLFMSTLVERKMMIEPTPSEPSMDEILASIRRIISTDSKEENQQSFYPVPETEDILDLTHALPDEFEKTQAPLPSDSHLQGLEEWTSAVDKAEPFEEKEKNSKDSALQTTFYGHAANQSFENTLLSQTTISETAHAFQLLNKMAQEQQKPSEPQLQEGIGGQTLENLMKEMLKPLLKEWLDAHLPALVRSVVTQQVEKIVTQKGG
jgi:hypothetical protein